LSRRTKPKRYDSQPFSPLYVCVCVGGGGLATDPFGIDANDLPLYRMLQCYRETLQTTLISNTPSAQPHVGLFIAIKKMAKTLPSDYPLKAGSPEYENMNRLCILKTCVTACPQCE
jgi:hypothetical protein